MGNGASSVVNATGGGVPSQAGCLGGENFQAKISMLKDTPLGQVLSETDLVYFSAFFSLETLAPHCHVPMCAGELLVVGEGEVQVYVIQAGLDAKTKEQSFVLCTKRKGDLIWVPTVTRLAKQKSSSDDASGNHFSGGGAVATGAGNGTTDIAHTPHSGKHKDLYNLLDTTYIDSLYGATLLKVKLTMVGVKSMCCLCVLFPPLFSCPSVRTSLLVSPFSPFSYLHKSIFYSHIPPLQLDRGRYEDLTSGIVDAGDEHAPARLDLTALRRVLDCNMEDYLRKVPLFRDISPTKLAVLGEMCNYEFIKTGHRVCSEGEAGNEIFIVLDGHLGVFTSGTGGVLPLATLGPGDYFGELAALIRIKRIATVLSTEDTLLASIKRHDFRSFMTIMPDVRAAMDKVVKEHLLYKYAKVGNRFFPSPPPAPLSPMSPSTTSSSSTSSSSSFLSPAEFKDRRLAFYNLCEVEDVDPDRILLYEHDDPGDIYFLSEGQVRLVRREEDGSDTSIVLTAGSILGARAAVLKAPQQYTAMTEQVCVFLKLGPAAIVQHFADHPEVKATLEVLFKRRGTPLATLLQCPDAHQVFEAHLKEEFTWEHLSFYDDAIAFQKLMAGLAGAEAARTDGKSSGGQAPAAAERVKAAVAKLAEIHRLYLGADAPSPLNIPDAQRQCFLAAYDAKDADSGENAELERLRRLAKLLEEVKREVLALLERDNYSRFKVRWFGEIEGLCCRSSRDWNAWH